MRIARSWKVVAVLGVAATMALTACTQKSQSGGEAGSGSGGAAGGGPVKVAFVPKLQGVPYFEAMNAGGQKAAAALGNVQWLYQGPTQADAAAQADIVRSFIQQKVNTLIVAPNDPDSMAPLLQEAKAQGIHVATADTDAPNSVREAFVNQATAQGIGESLTDALLKPMGGQGKYAIVSCGQTAENLNSWIKVQKEYTATKYPQAQIVDTVYAGEDQAKATQMATDLMNAHPDLTGLVGECTSSARRQQDRQGVHRRARHPAVDEAVPGEGLVVLGDPVERREPRLPHRVDRRPAGGEQAVRRDQRRRRRAPADQVRRLEQDVAPRPAAGDHQGQRRPVQLLSP
jgi:ABC-type sugar transport system substrate-binding protein